MNIADLYDSIVRHLWTTTSLREFVAECKGTNIQDTLTGFECDVMDFLRMHEFLGDFRRVLQGLTVTD